MCLAADQLGADARQLALLPLRMLCIHGFGYHQAQNRVAQELEALIIFRRRPLFAGLKANRAVDRLFSCGFLVHQGTVREGAHQQIVPGKPMPECGLQFGRCRFHVRLCLFPVPVWSLNAGPEKKIPHTALPVILLDAAVKPEYQPKPATEAFGFAVVARRPFVTAREPALRRRRRKNRRLRPRRSCARSRHRPS